MASNPYTPTGSQFTPAQPQPTNGWGLAGFIISLVGLLLTCGLVSPLGLLISLIGLLKRPRGYAIAGTIVGALGTALIAGLAAAAAAGLVGISKVADEVGKKLQTDVAISDAINKVKAFRQENGSLPSNDEGEKLVVEIKDGWGESLHYERKGEADFIILSSGPDKRFFTDDDKSSADAGRIEVDGDLQIETGDGGVSDGPVIIPPGDGATTPAQPEIDLPDATPPEQDEEEE